jgi:REP element-mobilizing transposase RayT
MTRPRSHIAPPDLAGTYHCVQRCVRRAFLCGVDHDSGRSFEHRKAWVESRIHLVAECYAVAIHAYAVMSNHLHLVLRIDPVEASAWSDEDVAARWVRLFPPREDTEAAIEHKCMRLLADPARLDMIRRRLGSLSWLMRCLVEPIARSANREDGCKGRFWEGRYKCQALCDERSVLAAMAYVDLNPIRAGIADRLDASVHTSVATRISAAQSSPMMIAEPLKPIAGNLPSSRLHLTTADYLQLLEWTGRTLAPDKRGRIAQSAPTIVSIIDRNPACWTTRVAAFGGGWARAAGSAQDLIILAERLGQRWLKGIRLAARLG